MSMILDGSNGVTFNDSSLQGAAASPFGLKNRIINGAMDIDQRNAGSSVTPTSGQYTLDRWSGYQTTSSKYSVQQVSANANTSQGFQQSLRVTSSSAYTITSGDIFAIYQWIEGYNVADLAWGTASAKTVTLSFFVRSSLTGTFGGSLRNSDGSRSYPFTYTISSADTWERKTITVTGDTSGTWLTTNGAGLQVNLSLGTGSTYSGTAGAWAGGNYISATGATSVVGTNGATWYVTGVQLEVGSTATPFERRMYGNELALCQRYYQTCGQAATGRTYGSGSIELAVPFKVTMRSAPTATLGGFSGSQAVVSQYGVGNVTMSSILGYSATVSGSYFNPAISGGTTGAIVGIINGDAFGMSAEL